MHNHALTVEQISATVAVVGLGKIGLPLAVQYARHGWRVIGCDVNPQVVEKINAGVSHVQEEPELIVEVPRLVHEGWLSATVNTTEAVRQANVVVVIVPVMVNDQHEIVWEAIDAATTAIGAGLQPGTLVLYETTLPVGTTAQRFRRILEATAQLTAGEDFLLAYSPERVSSGFIFRDLRTYPKVVGGIDERSTAAAVTFYRAVLDADIMSMVSSDDAEFVKLIETTYRDVNIALANEFAQYADTHGLHVSAAIAAANTQPHAYIHTPGVGVGGHCIPVYPYFLLNGVPGSDGNAQQESSLRLVRSARQINDEMAEYAVQRIEAVIGSLAAQAVLILGVAYRGNVRETAFTSARLLQEALWQHRAIVYADDPLYSAEELESLGYTPLPTEGKRDIQAIILQANHTVYRTMDFSDYNNCGVVLDGRGVLSRSGIESLGMHYIAIGDGVSQSTVDLLLLREHAPVLTATSGATEWRGMTTHERKHECTWHLS